MSCLCYLCLFAKSGVQLHLVCPVLPVSLDCSFFIALSVFSNIGFIKHGGHFVQLDTVTTGIHKQYLNKIYRLALEISSLHVHSIFIIKAI